MPNVRLPRIWIYQASNHIHAVKRESVGHMTNIASSPPETAPLSDPLRHLGAIRRLLELILLALSIIGLYFAKEVVMPLLMGAILALTLSPLVRGLQRKGMAPPITAIALIFGLAVAIGVAGVAFSGPVSDWVSQAPKLEAQLKAKFVALTSSVDAVRSATEKAIKSPIKRPI